MKNLCQQTIFLTPTNKHEVLKSIKLLKRNKAFGPFSIPTKFLKLFQKELRKPMSLIINLPFSTRTFQVILKIANNLLLYKRGSFSLYQLQTNLFTIKPEQNNRKTCPQKSLKFPNWTKCLVWKTIWFQKQPFYYACTYRKNKISLWLWAICMWSILRSAKQLWHS